MQKTFTLCDGEYGRCSECKRLINVTHVRGDAYVCKTCRHLRYKGESHLPRLTLKEQRQASSEIINTCLKLYFKTMKEEYAIKNKR